jgi:hypothetical protein
MLAENISRGQGDDDDDDDGDKESVVTRFQVTKNSVVLSVNDFGCTSSGMPFCGRTA